MNVRVQCRLRLDDLGSPCWEASVRSSCIQCMAVGQRRREKNVRVVTIGNVQEHKTQMDPAEIDAKGAHDHPSYKRWEFERVFARLTFKLKGVNDLDEFQIKQNTKMPQFTPYTTHTVSSTHPNILRAL